MNDQSLRLNEIYRSLQGESTHAGLPCVFIRLTACDLRCTYCDTPYAFTEGTAMTLSEILAKVEKFGCRLVEITGGEPLLQKNVLPLMKELCDRGLTVLLETSGAHDISPVDPRVIRIMDLKTPSSSESDRNLLQNIRHLHPGDEVKFVIGSREDFDWACRMVSEHGLLNKVAAVLFSPVHPHAGMTGQTAGHAGLDPKLLAEWILADKLDVRMQLQIHKYIWPAEQRGV
jgi:7-carboxy-7-deazaguanine synthase